jgi:hypothetical protein
MGIAFILLGLVVVGVLADFVVENDLADAAGRAYALFGGSFTLTQTQIVIGAALLGALALALLVVGVGLLRGSWGRRRARRHRISDLERENAELRAAAERARLAEVAHHDEDVRVREVVVPEPEPAAERERVHAERAD